METAAEEAVRQRWEQHESKGLSLKDVETIGAAEALARGYIWEPSRRWVQDVRDKLGITRKRYKYGRGPYTRQHSGGGVADIICMPITQ